MDYTNFNANTLGYTKSSQNFLETQIIGDEPKIEDFVVNDKVLGIDAQFSISGIKNVEAIEFIQIVRVSNDDKKSEAELNAQGEWLSPDRLFWGKVDVETDINKKDSDLFYYTKAESKEAIKYDTKTDKYKCRYIDIPSILVYDADKNNTLYKKIQFAAYILKIGKNSKTPNLKTMAVLGYIYHWYEYDDKSKKYNKTNLKNVANTFGKVSFSDIALQIISKNPKANKEFLSYKLL